MPRTSWWRRGGPGIRWRTTSIGTPLDWLAGEVKAKGTYGSEELERTVYGLYVLSRAGKADLGTMDFLRQKQLQESAGRSRGRCSPPPTPRRATRGRRRA